MAIHKISSSKASLSNILAEGFHYVIILPSDGDYNTDVISSLQQVGLSTNIAKEIYLKVLELCEVGTLNPQYHITLLPPYFWLAEEMREKYFSDLIIADNMINSNGIYVKSYSQNFEELLLLSKNKEIMEKEWYIIE